MKKCIVKALIIVFVIGIFPVTYAYNEVELVAKYDMSTVKNLVDESQFPLTSAVLVKNDNSPYNDIYRTDSTAGATIAGLPAKLGNSFTIDTYFKQQDSTGGQSIAAIGDSKCIYFGIGHGSNYFTVSVLYTKDNGDGTVNDAKADYRPTNTSKADWKVVDTGAWNHLVASFDEETGVPIVYINENKIELVRFDENDLTDYTIKPFSADACFYLNRQPALNNVTTNGITWQTWGGGYSRFRFSDTSIYRGVLSDEELEQMSKKSSKFEPQYNVALMQNDIFLSRETLISGIFESTPIRAVISDITANDVTNYTVYLEDADGVRITGEISVSSENEAEILFSPAVGEYRLVIDKSVGNKGGVRNEDYTLEFSVIEDLDYRAEVRTRLSDGAGRLLHEGESDLLSNALHEYAEFLKIRFDEFDKCIGADKVLKRLAEYIDENSGFNLFEISVEFSSYAVEQAARDFSDSVAELNEVLAGDEFGTAAIENIIFNKYESCFSISSEKKTAYEALLDKGAVWEAFRQKKYPTELETVKETIEKIKSEINAQIFKIEKKEFFIKLDNAAKADLETLIEAAVTVYGADFELENTDYVAYKDTILDELAKASLTEESFVRQIYRSVLAAALSAVSVGDRDRVSNLLNLYKDYVMLPTAYTNASDKSAYHKKMIGKAYTMYNLEAKLQEAVNEADNESSATSKPTGGSGGSSSGGFPGKTSLPYAGISIKTAAGENISATDEIRPANGEKELFIDIDGVNWAKEAIEFLADKDVLVGRSEGVFEPEAPVSREEMVKIIVTAFDITGENKNTEFYDVADNAWYCEYVDKAVGSGIIMGMSENLFGAGTEVTREDMAVMLFRIIEAKGLIFIESDDTEAFSDADAISDYAIEKVNRLRAIGIMNGADDNMFMPKEQVTRAEAAQAIYNILKDREESA